MNKSVLIVLPLLAAIAGCQSITGERADEIVLSSEGFVADGDPAALGREHFVRADYALAERHFRRAVELKPADSDSWVGLAASYDQLGRFDLADRAYDKAIQLSGSTFEILNNRGFSYTLRGDATRAAQMFEQAKRLRPRDPIVSNNLVILRQSRS